MLARVNQRARVGHDADMAGEEDQVAPLELVASYVGFGTERRELEVAVARQLHAGGAPRKLDQPRTVDALARTPAPDIGGADQRLGHPRGIGFDGVELDERDRKSVVWGKRVSVRVDPGGLRINKK